MSDKKMTYDPMTDNERQEWIDFLGKAKDAIENVPEAQRNTDFLGTKEGDVATMQDIVGKFLATITGQTVTSN